MLDLNEDDGKYLREVLSRSATDTEFRRTLLKDPHAAVKQATGIALPKDLKLRFLEQPKELDALVVLPNLIDQPGELTPEELQAVAGGTEELEFICWDTCTKTCEKSCSNTCAVTGVGL